MAVESVDDSDIEPADDPEPDPDAVRTGVAVPTARSNPTPAATTSHAGLPVYGLPAPLGKYTLVERLGVGGMAEVFLATEDDAAGGQHRHVIKRCLPHLAMDARFIEMFLREARVAARLHHPNVVAVHELGQVANTYFLVMEFVDGLTLRKLALRAWGHKKAMPMELILSAMADAALGLHHAHTLTNEDGTPVCLVHRDVSPENLMIDVNGVTKVLDFGIARAANASTLTKTGELKGKIPFMSPEHIRGDNLDGRADIYALGITMYWLLTGKRPHHAPSELVLLNEILYTPVIPPAKINDQVPADVNDLVMAMIDRDRDNRPTSALVVHEALAQALSARLSVVAPFVREVLALPEPPARSALADPDEPSDAGFIPSTPHTQTVLSGWNRVGRIGEPSSPRIVGSMPPRAPVEEPLPLPVPKSRAPLVAAAVAALAASVVGVLAFSGAEDPAPTGMDAGVVALAADGGTAAAIAVAVADAGAGTEPVTEPATLPVTLPATDVKLRPVQLRAPPHVSWTVSKGVAVRGSGAAELPASQRSVRAVDKKTGGVSFVPIELGVADYGKLGAGTLEVRALPFATVSVGALSLGATPFPAQRLTEGTYEVKLAFEKRTETRTVKIGRGKTERVIVDFRKK